ncbi:MAG: hypothetical protein WKF30_15420 [Pyrinomonadaceae bacterium]
MIAPALDSSQAAETAETATLEAATTTTNDIAGKLLEQQAGGPSQVDEATTAAVSGEGGGDAPLFILPTMRAKAIDKNDRRQPSLFGKPEQQAPRAANPAVYAPNPKAVQMSFEFGVIAGGGGGYGGSGDAHESVEAPESLGLAA